MTRSLLSFVGLVAAAMTASVSPASAEVATKSTAAGAKVTVDYNVRIPMRDGVTLSADIYRPAAPGKYAAIVVRNPYTKSGAWALRGQEWAARGYVFVIEDVRGRGDSDGTFYPLVNEAADGVDSYAWIARQAWSSGKIGGLGGSYSAWTQLYPAAAGGSPLTTIVAMAVPPDPDRGFPFAQGVAIPATAAWLASIDGRMYQSLQGVDLQAAYDGRPLVDMDRRMGRRLPAWRDWVTNGEAYDYWAPVRYQERLLKADIPALWVSGWYDDVLVGATDNFTAMSTRATSAAARSRQWLILGPWGHATNGGRKLGDIDFGADAVIDLEGLQKRWYDHWLNGVDNGVEKEPHVKLFVMGSNRWVAENEWPIARTQYVSYFLHSGGQANTLNGDGVLSTTPPRRSEPADRYQADPMNPAPYATGLDSKQMGGPDDYRPVEARKDVLVYTTAAFAEPIRVCGPLRVSLYAASSAKDTDWAAKLLDVHPDGFAQRLNDGIVRARFHAGTAHPQPVPPGVTQAYTIDLWSTCLDVQPGHRLRLEIASSAAGKYDVNLNTGGDQATGVQGVVADQVVRHDAAHPSALILPIVPAAPVR